MLGLLTIVGGDDLIGYARCNSFVFSLLFYSVRRFCLLLIIGANASSQIVSVCELCRVPIDNYIAAFINRLPPCRSVIPGAQSAFEHDVP